MNSNSSSAVDKSILDRVVDWTFNNLDGYDYNDIHNKIEFLEKHSFRDYHPTIGPYPPFFSRLKKWLENLSGEEDQKIFFRLVPEIFFLGSDEFISLYRTAFNEIVIQWTIDVASLKITEQDFHDLLEREIQRTWFCPITDSMHISDFCHVNNIEGISYRPDWRSLTKFGDKSKITDYMKKNGFERIVLLEDFVGSGGQLSGTDTVGSGSPKLGAVDFAASLPGTPPILVIPLVICPVGYKLGKQIEKKCPSVTFSPVYILSPDLMLTSTPSPNEMEIFAHLRDLVLRIQRQNGFPYDPFGFCGTGAIFVMYTNCPDNTLPIIHFKSDQWQPLFPRSSRI
jgi:hypothetical protein